MNPKKVKRSKEESLLISYDSNQDRGNRSSESDNSVQPLDLPPTRLRRPRSRKLHVTPQSRTRYSPWNALQVTFVLFTVGAMISLMWFTVILKTSLESMKKRVISLESYDRSTTREYGDLSKDMTDKYQRLKTSEEEAIKLSDEHFKSILKQIAYLNSTVIDLQKRIETPESANTLTKDIDSLKKGMADTGGEITELKDKIKQLTDLAGQEHGKVDELKNQFFNLSVQVAQALGKPTPKPLSNTGTPPVILRLPVSSDEDTKLEQKVSFRNVSATISAEVARVMGIVTTVNHTISNEVVKLGDLMRSLLTEVKKHVTIIDDLRAKVSPMLKLKNSSVVSNGPHVEGAMEHLFNLSLDVTTLSEDVNQHSRKLAKLVLDVTQVNRSLYHHQHESATQVKSVTCNCSAEVGKLWEQLSSNKLDIESIRQQLEALQNPIHELPNTTLAPDHKETTVKPRLTETTQNVSVASGSPAYAAEELEKEDIHPDSKLSPTSASNGGNFSVKGENFTRSDSMPTEPVSYSSKSVAPSNSTGPSEVIVANSTDSRNQSSLLADTSAEQKDIKLPATSSEESLEESLENV